MAARETTKTITVSLPVDIAVELESRCQQFGVQLDRLVAVVLLNHLNNKTTEVDIGWPLLDRLDAWEQSNRRMNHWEAHSRDAEGKPPNDETSLPNTP
jgi:hypothetical protein